MGLIILTEVDKLIKDHRSNLMRQGISEDRVFIIVSPDDHLLINAKLEDMCVNDATRQSYYERNDDTISYKGYSIIKSTIVSNNSPLLVIKCN